MYIYAYMCSHVREPWLLPYFSVVVNAVGIVATSYWTLTCAYNIYPVCVIIILSTVLICRATCVHYVTVTHVCHCILMQQ